LDGTGSMKLEICYYALLLALSGSVRYLLDPTILQYGYIALHPLSPGKLILFKSICLLCVCGMMSSG